MVLGTLRPDGTIQMTIVWFEYVKGIFKVSTIIERIKYKNVVKDPRVSFVIYDLHDPYNFLQVGGKVTKITKTGAHELIDHLSQTYLGTTPYHGDPKHQQNRVVLEITPDRFFDGNLK